MSNHFLLAWYFMYNQDTQGHDIYFTDFSTSWAL